jgi:pimeloyl-ACP methyl ester carboxylesterase
LISAKPLTDELLSFSREILSNESICEANLLFCPSGLPAQYSLNSYRVIRGTFNMSNHRLIRKDHLILIVAAPLLLIIASSLISNNGYFSTKIVYSPSDPGQVNSNITNSVNIQNIPLEKVRVGDIDIAYKMFGEGAPILLVSGASVGIDSWEPSTLTSLSSNHIVIVFDSRGVGNTTTGSKLFSIQQLANDTAGLLDALKIQKADVLGLSLGSYIAQQLTITYPEMVNRLILVGSSCGGKDSIPKPPQVIKLQSEIVNKSLNNISISQEEIKSLVSASLGSGWIRLNPDSLENIPEDLFASISPNTVKQQFNIGMGWESTEWNGACDKLAKIAKPTLVITGTDDNAYQPHANSLIIAGKIPGTWLIQIKDAGHAVMSQYPDEINKILHTFLSTTTLPS